MTKVTAAELKAKAKKLAEEKRKEELAEDVKEVMGGEEIKDLVVTPEYLQKISGVGMSKVDPLDIRPPQVLLVQRSSTIEEMVDFSGKQAEVGQYFHTGKREIYEDFECYFIFAAKGEYVDKRKPDKPVLPKYSALGAMADDLSLFGMTFKATYLNALSSLWTASQSQHAPMFAFKVKMETKKLEGNKGAWYVPVCRVGEMVKDNDTFSTLYDLAVRFDRQAERTEEVLEGND